jgi:hypothetical protein
VLNTRAMVALVVAFMLAVSVAASVSDSSFKARWIDAMQDLAPPSTIPEDTLRAHGEKVLRERLIAKDDESK